MSDIGLQNTLFTWRVGVIEANARQIEGAAHLFDGLSLWETSLEKLDLRLSAKRLREAADKLDDIATRLHGPATAFPDYEQLQAAE